MTEGVPGHRTSAQLGLGPPPLVLPPGSTPEALPSLPPSALPGTPLLPSPSDGRAASPPRAGSWRMPLVPVDLPTPRSLVDALDQLRTLHPRDPDIRFQGRTSPGDLPADETPDGPQPPGPADGDAQQPGVEPERSDAAKLAIKIGMAGGLTQNAVDIARLVKKYPEAYRAGNLGTALRLTALTRPDSRVIDPEAPRTATTASNGKSFTKVDSALMRTSVLMGSSLAVLQLATAVPNLADALRQDGEWHENLAGTTSGRAGVLQLAGGTMGISLFAAALRQTRGEATGFMPKLMAAAKAPIVARPIFGQIATATAFTVMSNELGFLDFLNRGDTRSVARVLRDAAQGTPILNDPGLRTAVLLGGTAWAGVKLGRAAAAGTLPAVGRVPLAAASVVTGLLGAQLVGALRGFDKPAERAAGVTTNPHGS